MLRMHCEYEKTDGYVIAKLPQRLVDWYKLDGLAESDYRLIPEPEKAKIKMDVGPLVKRRCNPKKGDNLGEICPQ